jgi:hypothetical protein
MWPCVRLGPSSDRREARIRASTPTLPSAAVMREGSAICAGLRQDLAVAVVGLRTAAPGSPIPFVDAFLR